LVTAEWSCGKARNKVHPQQTWINLKPFTGKEALARVSAVIGRRKKERENMTCCKCERDIVACTEKMAAALITPVYRGHVFYFAPLYLLQVFRLSNAVVSRTYLHKVNQVEPERRTMSPSKLGELVNSCG